MGKDQDIMTRSHSFWYYAGNFFRKVTSFGGGASAIGIFVMTVLVTVSVIFRRVIEHPLVFSDEYTAYLLVFCVYFGAAYTLREDAHIRVDVVTIRLSEKMRRFLRAITSCLSVIYGVVLTVYSMNLVIYYKEIGQEALSVLETPTWIPAISVPVGFGILAFQMILCAIEDVSALFKGSAVRKERA